MILLAGIIAGLIAATIRARITKRNFRIPVLKYSWLVILAFVPQFLAFQLRPSSDLIPDAWIPAILVFSQLILVVFVVLNLKGQRGIWLLGTGLLLNLSIILANKGLMPIAPEMVASLYPEAAAGSWAVGERLARSKDVVIPVEKTQLWILSDIFKVPEWLHYPIAFSLGDIFIALGAFLLLFSMSDATGA